MSFYHFDFCFDKVSNFQNRILTIQKRKLVVQNCQRNCTWWSKVASRALCFISTLGSWFKNRFEVFIKKKLWNIRLTHCKQITLKDCSTTFSSWKYYNEKCHISIITAAFKASVKTNRIGSEDLPQQVGFCH